MCARLVERVFAYGARLPIEVRLITDAEILGPVQVVAML